VTAARPHYRPGAAHRWLRRSTQIVAVVAILLGPLLGGWQRVDKAELAAFDDAGWNLPVFARERLPEGAAARRAYEVNTLLGGGIAADYLGIPFADPLAGTLAALRSSASPRSLVAIALPVLLALVGGRLFCGWLCPFGTLSRALDAVTVRLRFLPRPRLPARRPVRWIVLAGCVALSLGGVHLVLYLALPYLLLQQSIYAFWLLGGGSVISSVLLGLVLAGLLLGPNVYCGALCPTGAGLSLLGRARVVRMGTVEPSACGAHCQLCDVACWLDLDPASGDAGPDCDLCGRCVEACPRINLGITLQKPFHNAASTLLLCSAATLVGWLAPAEVWAATPTKPTLVFEQEARVGDVVVALSILDVSDVKLDLDWETSQQGSELSVYLARGPLAEPDAQGFIALRESYAGPLRVEVQSAEGASSIAFERPSHPISTQRPTIYRRALPARFAEGDRITVAKIPGWLEEPVSFDVAERGTRRHWSDRAWWAGSALLVYAGLMALALGVGRPTRELRND
jgi:ferredoxin-type protein NapH